jgi:DNA-binding transcriptional LysR family regulator
MDKLRAMELFAAIVEERSLTRAARRFRTSLPTVTRSLAALEATLGVRLINRTTRRLAPTEEGVQYYEHARRVLAEIAETESVLGERRRVPAGRVTVTAPVLFGRTYVAPLLVEFAAAHPDVSVQLWLLDRVVNLAEEGTDLAVRLGHLSESALMAVAVGETPRLVCASPAYLERRGTPQKPADLRQHSCLRFIDSGGGGQWAFAAHGRARRSRAESVRMDVSGSFATNHLETLLDACSAGLGLGQVLGYQAAERLRLGALVRVLRKFEPAPLPVHIVYQQARLLSVRLRLLIDFLTPRLRARALAWSPDVRGTDIQLVSSVQSSRKFT